MDGRIDSTNPPADEIPYGTLLEDLIGLDSEEDFRTLISQKPEVLGPEMREFLERITEHEGRGISFRRQLRLVSEAVVAPELAWRSYSRRLARDTEIGAELGPLMDQTNEALAEGRPADAIEIAEPAIEKAKEAEMGLLVAVFEAQRAEGLLVLGDGDRGTNIEEAIAGLASANASATSWAVQARAQRHGRSHRSSEDLDATGDRVRRANRRRSRRQRGSGDRSTPRRAELSGRRQPAGASRRHTDESRERAGATRAR